MGESLYPNILFHFTGKNSLKRILDETFKISYAREIVLGPDTSREFAVPMVSFCDLRLSELQNHIDKYGNYGIGLSKDWANKKGLNPVMYVNRSSQLADKFNYGLNGIYNKLKELSNPENIRDVNKYYLNILKTYQFLKNYEGHLIREGEIIDKNFRFADEREWRYVPELEKTRNQPFVAISNINSPEKKKKHNERINDLSLSFQPKDIRYLVVKNEADIDELIEIIPQAKRRFGNNSRRRLISRILTADQIKNDI